MPLVGQVDPEKILSEARDGAKVAPKRDQTIHSFAYASRYNQSEIPKFEIPKKSSDSKAAYRMIHDELMLDGKPELNCATFLTGWMEPEANQLINENINKNFVDADGFPSSMIIHERCISMLSSLWKNQSGNEAIGTVCGGSSEGVILGGLAMKWAWKQKRIDAGLDYSKPNCVLGSNAHCCIEKFARYFDVEARIIPVKKEHQYVMDPADLAKYVDENTIGVFSILGSTYTGHYEDVAALSNALDKIEEETGLDIPIHVDAASGGFVAPFATPKLSWGFDVKRVVSINSSGHKYGLVYAGLGWVVWKNKNLLHKDLIFEMHYLGVTEYSFSLNFSRPSTHLIAQYYNFLRLGHEGYRDVMLNCLHNARYLSRALEQSGFFTVLSDVHRLKGRFGGDTEIDKKSYKIEQLNVGLPLVAFTVSQQFLDACPGLDVADVSGLVRTKGWLIPAYNLPKGEEQVKILRIVVKENASEEMIDRLVSDIISASNALYGKSKSSGDMGVLKVGSGKSIFEIMEEGAAENPFLAKQDANNNKRKSASKKEGKDGKDGITKHGIPKPKRSNTFSSVC